MSDSRFAHTTHVKCPLCTCAEAEELQRLAIKEIIAAWRTVFDLDIQAELSGLSNISHLRCPSCGLEYYAPSLAGSQHLYAQLQLQPWYYSSDKWEFRAALREITPRSRVLEVGCGTGAFLDLVRARGGEAAGIELNAAAVEIGRQMGRPLAALDVCALAESEPESYDVVCNFQVLEHVAQPHSFLAACVRLLRPGGRLCIGVPNNDGYVGLQKQNAALLNQPPHHVTRWGVRTLSYLTQLFPIKVDKIAFEPLSRIHVPDYVEAHLLTWKPLAKLRFVRGGSRTAALMLLHTVGLRRLLKGHTVYVSYIKFSDHSLTPSARLSLP